MAETSRQKQAFEYYYSLGPSRSITQTAKQFGVSRPSVSVWAKNYNWEKRVAERDDKNLETLRKQTDEDMVKQMSAYKTIINASVKEYIQKLKNNKIKIEKVDDFIKLVDLDLKLNGAISKVASDNEKDKDIDINLSISNQSETIITRLFNEASRFGGLENIKSKEEEEVDTDENEV